MANNKDRENKHDLDQTSGSSEDNPRAHMSEKPGSSMGNLHDVQKQPEGTVNRPETNPIKGMSYQPSDQEKEALPGQSPRNKSDKDNSDQKNK